MLAGGVHQPVMVREVLRYLDCRRGGVFVDATLGGGGHGAAILEASSPDGFLIGLDRDREALALAEEALGKYRGRYELRHGNFAQIAGILDDLGRPRVDGLLLDLGISSWQVDSPGRGFSFRSEAPLDMRMDREEEMNADRLVRESTEEELARIIREFGEERRAKRIAASIKAAARQGSPLTTTALAKAVEGALGGRGPRGGRIHPATRTFQALRIAVNRETEALEEVLGQLGAVLLPGGRCCCLAYHSLEDRIVKNVFREISGRGARGSNAPFELLTRKPVRPGDEEVALNPRARSARLRAIRRREAA